MTEGRCQQTDPQVQEELGKRIACLYDMIRCAESSRCSLPSCLRQTSLYLRRSCRFMSKISNPWKNLCLSARSSVQIFQCLETRFPFAFFLSSDFCSLISATARCRSWFARRAG